MWNDEPKQSERNGCDASQGRSWGLKRGTEATATEMLDAGVDEDADSDSEMRIRVQRRATSCWPCVRRTVVGIIFGDLLALTIAIASPLQTAERTDWMMMMMTRCDAIE